MKNGKSLQELAMILVENKNEKNLKNLYDRIKPGLIHYAKNILKDSDSAEFVVAEAFVKAWNNLHQYNSHFNFSTWIYRIVHNEALLYIRKNRNKNTYSIDDMTSTQIGEASQKSDNGIPFVEVLERENEMDLLYDKVVEEINNLPDSYKSIMIDREINRLKYKEIEDKYDMKTNAVKTKIRRGRILVRKNIAKNSPNLFKIYQEN